MSDLILLRHGESLWNAEGRFTGWQDADLSECGIGEAHRAATLVAEAGLAPERAWVSLLTRAIRTLGIVLDDLRRLWIPVEKTWRLNERHYGALEGKSKQEMAKVAGDAQVAAWRRSYTVAPPSLDFEDPRHPRFDARYLDWDPRTLPVGESLKQAQERVLPCWTSRIQPVLKTGACVLVVAHGNSLRALIKVLDDVSEEAISHLNVPTGIPLWYRIDDAGRALEHRFLGDARTTRDAIERVAQGT
jgi:2,3-bisphosphoglycerate-dependent phosphoglycerate mutase